MMKILLMRAYCCSKERIFFDNLRNIKTPSLSNMAPNFTFKIAANFFLPSPADFSPCIGRFVHKLIHWPPSCGHFENDSGHNIGLNDSLLVFMSLENVSDCSFYQINLKLLLTCRFFHHKLADLCII